MSLSDKLRIEPGRKVSLAAHDPDGTPGIGSVKDAQKELADLSPRLADLQEKLFAEGYTGGKQALLLVIQGMDTSGKGGTLKHCVGILDPGGIRIHSFKRPTEEELAHDFLWRVEKEVPPHGYVGIFDRSHYEDVLVQRVHKMAPAKEIERRYGAINDFEKRLVQDGTTIVKVMLHVSAAEQRRRFLDRLDDRTKQWKYKPDDVVERGYWTEYMKAYEIALERCSTELAPWYVVSADNKPYAHWAVSTLLVEALEQMGVDWPAPTYDVAAEKKRVSDA